MPCACPVTTQPSRKVMAMRWNASYVLVSSRLIQSFRGLGEKAIFPVSGGINTTQGGRERSTLLPVSGSQPWHTPCEVPDGTRAVPPRNAGLRPSSSLQGRLRGSLRTPFDCHGSRRPSLTVTSTVHRLAVLSTALIIRNCYLFTRSLPPKCDTSPARGGHCWSRDPTGWNGVLYTAGAQEILERTQRQDWDFWCLAVSPWLSLTSSRADEGPCLGTKLLALRGPHKDSWNCGCSVNGQGRRHSGLATTLASETTGLVGTLA